MKTKITTFLTITAIFMGASVTGQWHRTYVDGHDHNHFSIEELGDDIVVAGTIFNQGSLTNPRVQVMRLDNSGGIMWEQEYDLGIDERCFDIVVRDGDQLAITGYAQSNTSVPPRTFVMVIDANNGFVIDYSEYPIVNQSTGLNIIYSDIDEAYYVAGYESADILDPGSTVDKNGFVLSIDANSLSVNWLRIIAASAASGTHRNMANKLTEIPGTGIFVTGSVNNDPPHFGAGNVSTLRLMLDYGGGTIWDLTTISTNSYECGVDAVYRPHDDALFVLSNNSVVHTFEIHRIDNASSPGAFASIHSANNLYSVLGDVAGLSIKLDPINPGEDDQSLIVGGMMREMFWNNNWTDHSPSFIAKIDPHNFDVVWLRYIETNNLAYSSHDHDIFRAFYGQQPLIHYPDILAVFEKNFFLLGYAMVSNAYDLTITKTDLNGRTEEAADCEIFVSSQHLDRYPVPTGTDVFNLAVIEIPDMKYPDPTFHEPIDGCTPPRNQHSRMMGILNSTSESAAFRIYPNPVAEVLYIEIPLSDEAMQVDLQLFDAMGKVVIQRNGLYQPGAVEQIDISSLPNGAYFLSGNAGAYKITKPIMISH